LPGSSAKSRTYEQVRIRENVFFAYTPRVMFSEMYMAVLFA